VNQAQTAFDTTLSTTSKMTVLNFIETFSSHRTSVDISSLSALRNSVIASLVAVKAFKERRLFINVDVSCTTHACYISTLLPMVRLLHS
jgi:hypothetical protein